MKKLKYLLICSILTFSTLNVWAINKQDVLKITTTVPAPIIAKQYRIRDNLGFIWEITATALDGIFPSRDVVIDAFSESYTFYPVSQFSYFDLVALGITDILSGHNSEGIASSSQLPHVFVRAYATQGRSIITIDYASYSQLTLYGALGFHIIYKS